MTNPDRFAGARLLESQFPDDSGAQFPAVAAALASYGEDPSRSAAVIAALQDSRLLVPVVAMLGEVEYDDAGLAHDKSSDMAAVLMRGADGRMALLAFTGSEQLQAWNPQARPVAVPTAIAARSALQDGADALVLDVAGPATFVIEGEDLKALAAGWRLVEVDGRHGWLQSDR